METSAPEISDIDAVLLHINGHPESYTLSLSGRGDTRARFSLPAEALTVSPPVGGAFAGAMFGIYAFGDGEPVLDPADFCDIRMTG